MKQDQNFCQNFDFHSIIFVLFFRFTMHIENSILTHYMCDALELVLYFHCMLILRVFNNCNSCRHNGVMLTCCFASDAFYPQSKCFSDRYSNSTAWRRILLSGPVFRVVHLPHQACDSRNLLVECQRGCHSDSEPCQQSSVGWQFQGRSSYVQSLCVWWSVDSLMCVCVCVILL